LDIEIKKLTPDLLKDYLHFFETEAHADNPDEDRCYCVCWCSADHRIKTDFSSPEKRRELAVQYINDGLIQGYLAYHDGKVVGWCNANTKSECLNCTSWLRFMTSVDNAKPSPATKTKSVYCFAVAPSMKRKGVAAQLLERVCNDATSDGFNYIEAYPSKQFVDEFRSFMGPLVLYEKNGFTVFQEINDKYNDIYVVRKRINE